MNFLTIGNIQKWLCFTLGAQLDYFTGIQPNRLGKEIALYCGYNLRNKAARVTIDVGWISQVLFVVSL